MHIGCSIDHGNVGRAEQVSGTGVRVESGNVLEGGKRPESKGVFTRGGICGGEATTTGGYIGGA